MGMLDSMQFWKKKEEPDLSFPKPEMHEPALDMPPLQQGEPSFGSAHGFQADPLPLGAPLTPPDTMSMDNPQTSAYAFRPQAPYRDPTVQQQYPQSQYPQQSFQAQQSFQPQQGYGQQQELHQPGQVYTEHTRGQAPTRENMLEKELEIISSKLDYLKAALESINQRLANLEKKDSLGDYKW